MTTRAAPARGSVPVPLTQRANAHLSMLFREPKSSIPGRFACPEGVTQEVYHLNWPRNLMLESQLESDFARQLDLSDRTCDKKAAHQTPKKFIVGHFIF
jgi:hypothetical protein